MELLDRLEQEMQQLERRDLLRRRRIADSPCTPHLRVDKKPILAFCSNDYLGLAADPRVVEGLREGASIYGVGSGASPLISGHSRAHALLEERLERFVSAQIESARTLYFSNGYMANLALQSALGGPRAAIFSEALNHASLIDGARLSRAQVHIYPHSDVATLKKMLAASSAQIKLVVTDSVFSMDGDLAPLPELLTLCERHAAWLIVDDAHGFGVLGQNGHGALEHFGLRSPHLIYMGTLGKAAGVGGAFVAAHRTVIEWLTQTARPYIYSTASAPALAHALLVSLDLIEGAEGNKRRACLGALTRQLRSGLTPRRWRLLPSDTAIQPILIGSNDETLKAAAALYAEGLWVPAIRPPTVPTGTSRLRVTLSAAHSTADVARLVATLNALDGDA